MRHRVTSLPSGYFLQRHHKPSRLRQITREKGMVSPLLARYPPAVSRTTSGRQSISLQHHSPDYGSTRFSSLIQWSCAEAAPINATRTSKTLSMGAQPCAAAPR
jgi:hypothetical protein